jgi:hypothetical protein
MAPLKTENRRRRFYDMGNVLFPGKYLQLPELPKGLIERSERSQSGTANPSNNVVLDNDIWSRKRA